MKKSKNIKIERLPFLSWTVLPILGVLIATNYIFGLTRRPTWAIIYDTKPSVSGAATQNSPDNGVPEYTWDGRGIITFWFDDAWTSQYIVAFPVMKSAGLPGALAVPTNAIGWDEYMT